MGDMEHSFRVAVVQAGSILMDRAACTEKVVRLTGEAARSGAELVLFPEAFISGYPRGLTFGTRVGSRTEEGRRDWLRYWQSSVELEGQTGQVLCETAREHGVHLAVGIIERDAEFSGGTLFCTVAYFGPDGTLLGKHRKLKPTAAERLIWGEGDGSTLPVIDTPGGRIGSLICWENYMPLARAAMYARGVDIYLAPTADERERWQATLRHIALEGRCFVLGCNQYVTRSMYPDDLACRDDIPETDPVCSGGSCIVDPMGEYVVEPVYGREQILLADLDMSRVPASRMEFDATGHYNRPDVFRLLVNEERQVPLSPAPPRW
ncbi:MAG: carbon-nitrogen hydrolase family protein [Bacillota bacterium]